MLIINNILGFRMTIATRGQTVGLDSADNQTNVQVSARYYFFQIYQGIYSQCFIPNCIFFS